MNDWICVKCGKGLKIEEVFTIKHGSESRWNLAPLCEPCVDLILAEQEAACSR